MSKVIDLTVDRWVEDVACHGYILGYKEWVEEQRTQEGLNPSTEMDADDFMQFFRDDERLNTLSNDCRHEVFMGILSGNSDITSELLRQLIGDYDGGSYDEHIFVANLKDPKDLERISKEVVKNFVTFGDNGEYNIAYTQLQKQGD